MNELYSIMPAYIEIRAEVDWKRFNHIADETMRALKRAPRRKRKAIRERAERRIRACISMSV